MYFSISVYFLLFGLSGEPFLELTPPSPQSGKLKIFVDSKGIYRTNGPSSLPYLPTPSPGTTLSSSTATPGGSGTAGPNSTSSMIFSHWFLCQIKILSQDYDSTFLFILI